MKKALEYVGDFDAFALAGLTALGQLETSWHWVSGAVMVLGVVGTVLARIGAGKAAAS